MRRILLVTALIVAGGAAAPAEEPELVVTAEVDKTTVSTGSPVKLTVSITGDLAGAAIPPLSFPDGFVVTAQTQATNVALHGGTMERSISLVFILVPSKAGAFQLGPFTVEKQGKSLQTAPIEITVKKSPLPPTLKGDGERFTL
jgi:hypothetical protein